LIVVGVSTDPELHGDLSIQNGERAIAEADASGIDGLSGMDLLEAEARVIRVALEALIRFSSAAANMHMLGKAAVGVAEPASCS
jgi:hypothetical protein